MTKSSAKNLVPRPPVVVIMGHVDHGKTSLLDYIRKAKVAARESGGITQHVGAYEIVIDNPPSHKATDGQRKITFLDTPGHEAFSLMRERGAKAADIAVLVIAAEEGLKPQTKEALIFIQEAGIPFVIALNKTDLQQANQDKVKQQLSELEIYVEEWGGKIPCLPISAKTGTGINELLEMILLMAEMEELKANSKAEPKGVVIESSLDPKIGFTATTLVLDGTLAVGQTIYTQTTEAKVKSLENFLGERVKSLSFSSPAVIVGWDKQPKVGETFSTQPFDHAQNKPEANASQETTKEDDAPPEAASYAEVATKAELAQEGKTFSLVLKADVAGSLEALEAIIEQLFDEMKVKAVVQDKTDGPVSLSDIKTAEQTSSIIVNFRSKMTSEVRHYIRDRKIKIFESNIIYELREKLKSYLQELLKPDVEKLTGKLEILEIFSEKDKKNHQVVGGRLFEGKVRKNQKFNVKRTAVPEGDESRPIIEREVVGEGQAQLGEGKVLSIKKGKQEMESAEAVNEIGLQIETLSEVNKGDLFEFRVQ